MNWGHLIQGSATSQHFGGSSRTCPKRSSPFWRRCSLARTASPRPVLLSYGWRAWPARSPVPSTSCQDQSPLWAQPVHIHHPAGSSSARWGGGAATLPASDPLPVLATSHGGASLPGIWAAESLALEGGVLFGQQQQWELSSALLGSPDQNVQLQPCS